jgi:hypothetical protein
VYTFMSIQYLSFHMNPTLNDQQFLNLLKI